MTTRFLIVVSAIMVSIATCVAQTIPIDTALYTGTLPNGMTYYIRHNNEPAGRADCYLVHKVGSIMEEDDQRGIAHFLEHMAFNGTEHFPEQSIVDFLTENGMTYGGDINASTSFDQTIYHISNIPTARASLIDSVLLAMSDLSCKLTLDDKAIEKEKAIIEEEWRSQSNATVRIFERALPLLMGNSRFAHRIPIGDISIVRKMTREQLLRFYQQWFRPDLQAIVIVGDFDPTWVEQHIIRHMSLIPKPDLPPRIINDQTDINSQAFVACADKEIASPMVNAYFPFNDIPKNERNSFSYLRQNIKAQLLTTILNERLNKISLNPQAPLQYAGCSIGNFLVKTTTSALTLSAAPKTDMTSETLQCLATEALRVAKHGITPSELERAKTIMVTALDNVLAEQSSHTNAEYVTEYIDHFINGGYIPGIENECNLTKAQLNNITTEHLNSYAREIINFNRLRMLIIGNDSITLPSYSDIKGWVEAVMSANIDAQVDIASSTEPLLSKKPEPGKIVNELTDSTTGITTLSLSNGITVQLMPTSFKQNEILFNATSKGGYGYHAPEHYNDLRLIDHVVENSSFGQWSQAGLQQRLSTTPLQLIYQISEFYDDINGACLRPDIETLLQLNYLYFTDVTADTVAYNALQSRLASQAMQMASNPSYTFNDSIASTLYEHNVLYKPLSAQAIYNTDFSKVLDVYNNRMKCNSNFTFSIVGSFNIDSIKPLIEQYIASIPTANCPEMANHRISYATGDHDVVWLQKMQAPKGTIYSCIMGDLDYTLQNAILTDVAGQVLQVALNSYLREELRGTYGVDVSSALSRESNKWIINANFETETSRTQEMVEALAQVFDLILSYGTTPTLLDVIKTQLINQHETAAKGNSYWLAVLREKAHGVDTHSEYVSTINSLTIEQVNHFMATLDPTTRVRVIMQGY